MHTTCSHPNGFMIIDIIIAWQKRHPFLPNSSFATTKSTIEYKVVRQIISVAGNVKHLFDAGANCPSKYAFTVLNIGVCVAREFALFVQKFLPPPNRPGLIVPHVWALCSCVGRWHINVFVDGLITCCLLNAHHLTVPRGYHVRVSHTCEAHLSKPK